MIEDVKDFAAKLRFERLVNGNVLNDGKIDLLETRPKEVAYRIRAERAGNSRLTVRGLHRLRGKRESIEVQIRNGIRRSRAVLWNINTHSGIIVRPLIRGVAV